MTLKERYQRFRAWQQQPFSYENKSKGAVKCANCGMEFADNFCPRCGQQAGVGPISWKSVRQSIMLIWGMESRSLSHTLLQLLFRPGYLISDYISGRRQVSFPPVKMLLIVGVVYLFFNNLFFPEVSAEASAGAHDNLLYYNDFSNWVQNNPGWGMLALNCFFIFPLWTVFRNAPLHTHHTLPESFFIQVFISTLALIIGFIGDVVGDWFLLAFPVYYVVTLRQLFGYSWWGSLWRFIVCIFEVGILLILIVMTAMFFSKGYKISNKPSTYLIGFIFFTLIGAGIFALSDFISRRTARKRKK